MTLEREEALRLARESQKWPALEQPPSDLLPLLRDVLARALLALAADLEAAERERDEALRVQRGTALESDERGQRVNDLLGDLATAREYVAWVASIEDDENLRRSVTLAQIIVEARAALRSLGEKSEAEAL